MPAFLSWDRCRETVGISEPTNAASSHTHRSPRDNSSTMREPAGMGEGLEDLRLGFELRDRCFRCHGGKEFSQVAKYVNSLF